ncbi:quinolinate synthase NadA [Pseudovibrio sp. Tun.PSC04-5.I4]|uniref:quinolinate synthase NadA n=1 Tax=Pseudovibrio sp. Tun.PSC04-5.I4 TaxID=1798213 RepID=UPI000880D916|nr:quinolinate synthase NadA [Pseudovibrio sp. Tun.PSC04-5.I4]SDQ81341.1 quinolinate synthetase [Pseudovibrio sp. Tun.PSC04-5.I4]
MSFTTLSANIDGIASNIDGITASTGLTAQQRYAPVARPDLAYTPEVIAATADAYEKVKDFIPAIEWAALAPLIHAINKLKKERNAVILAHNYMTPDIFHGVADIVGDSLQLAKEAGKTEADVIVQCGVHFMAETSKILSPDKIVLIPDMDAGCSLAESITGADVRRLRAENPGVPIVTYVNTSAEVKAECDICCTSSNAVQVVEAMGADTVFLIPDQYLAANVNNQTDVNVLTYAGSCEVHERFTADELRDYRAVDPDVKIIAHPECTPEVVAEADFAGSTAHMIDWVKDNKPEKVMMITECSMADNVASSTPDVHYIRPCNLCPHMKRITLAKILDCLVDMSGEVIVEESVAARARASVERMINLKN